MWVCDALPHAQHTLAPLLRFFVIPIYLVGMKHGTYTHTDAPSVAVTREELDVRLLLYRGCHKVYTVEFKGLRDGVIQT